MSQVLNTEILPERLKTKGQEVIHQRCKEAGIKILIIDTNRFKTKDIRRDIGDLLYIMKRDNEQKDIVIINIHIPTITVSEQ